MEPLSSDTYTMLDIATYLTLYMGYIISILCFAHIEKKMMQQQYSKHIIIEPPFITDAPSKKTTMLLFFACCICIGFCTPFVYSALDRGFFFKGIITGTITTTLCWLLNNIALFYYMNTHPHEIEGTIRYKNNMVPFLVLFYSMPTVLIVCILTFFTHTPFMIGAAISIVLISLYRTIRAYFYGFV